MPWAVQEPAGAPSDGCCRSFHRHVGAMLRDVNPWIGPNWPVTTGPPGGGQRRGRVPLDSMFVPGAGLQIRGLPEAITLPGSMMTM